MENAKRDAVEKIRRQAGTAEPHELEKAYLGYWRALHLLDYLLGQYDRVVEIHEKVVMDTDYDRALHDDVVSAFRQAAEPVRSFLARED